MALPSRPERPSHIDRVRSSAHEGRVDGALRRGGTVMSRGVAVAAVVWLAVLGSPVAAQDRGEAEDICLRALGDRGYAEWRVDSVDSSRQRRAWTIRGSISRGAERAAFQCVLDRREVRRLDIDRGGGPGTRPRPLPPRPPVPGVGPGSPPWGPASAVPPRLVRLCLAAIGSAEVLNPMEVSADGGRRLGPDLWEVGVLVPRGPKVCEITGDGTIRNLNDRVGR